MAVRDDVLRAVSDRKAHGARAGKNYYRDFATDLHLASSRVAGYLRTSPFPDLVEILLGGDADLRFTSAMAKSAENRRHVDWHQDSANEQDGDRVMVTFWIALTDSTPDNGGLRIIPGSHRGGGLRHGASRSFPLDLEIETVDESASEDVEMRPGDMLLMHEHLVHASWPNVSGQLRLGLIAAFVPPMLHFAEFERKGSYRYLRRGERCWSPVTELA